MNKTECEQANTPTKTGKSNKYTNKLKRGSSQEFESLLGTLPIQIGTEL